MGEMRWLVGLVLFFPALLRATEPEKTLEVRLISESRTIAAGKKFYLGLHLDHPPGTHTYWKYPGIVGVATTIKWDLPAGFAAGEIEWPAPQVVNMAGHGAQGYEGETLLMIPITPPEKITAKAITLSAKVSWMCCGKTCQPATNVPFSITLPVGRDSEADSCNEPIFQRFHSKVPTPPTAWKSITVHREGDKIILTLDPTYRQQDPPGTDDSKIHFFTLDGQVDTDRNQQTEISNEGGVVMTMIASETGPKNSAGLPGVLVIPRTNPLLLSKLIPRIEAPIKGGPKDTPSHHW